MPCTAKKFECAREEMGRDYVPDVDLRPDHARIGPAHRMFGVDMMEVEPDRADTPFGMRSTAGTESSAPPAA